MALLGAGALGLTAVAGQKVMAYLAHRPANIQPRAQGHEDVARSIEEPSSIQEASSTQTADSVKKFVIGQKYSLISQLQHSARTGKAGERTGDNSSQAKASEPDHNSSSNKGSESDKSVGSYVKPVESPEVQTPASSASPIIDSPQTAPNVPTPPDPAPSVTSDSGNVHP